MPRVPRAPQAEGQRHNPLADEYAPSYPFKQKASHKKRKSRSDGDDENDHVIGTKAARKILRIGQELADEDEAQQKTLLSGAAPNPAFAFDTRFGTEVESDDENDAADRDAEVWEDENEELVEIESDHLDPNDLETFNRFNPPQFDDPILHPGEDGPPENSQTINLADLILEKIALHEAATAAADQEDKAVELAPKVIETYTLIGNILSRYKSGPLPKAFKILPTLPMPTLLAVLPYTNPSKWTPQAIFAATKLFISNKSPIAQSFLTNILLDRVRDDIAETRKLNVHLYNALRKALFRPQAFFRGLLFPLLSSGTCTLREAHIISSVLIRVSVPAIHSAVALSKLCEIAADQMQAKPESAGSTNLFIKVLLEKRYALPYQTVDALVFHFLRFKSSSTSVGGMDVDDREAYEGKLPVIWYQGLLAFARTYKDSITEDQREALLDLLLVRGHKDIASEVRRELLAGRGRGVVVEQCKVGDGGDDTMMGG